jgi:hypothetical protein
MESSSPSDCLPRTGQACPRIFPTPTHSSRIRIFDTLPFQLIELEKSYDDAAYLRALHQVELRSEPGTDLVYSNFGIKLIGFGLQQVYHQSLEELLITQILSPLGMKRTRLAVSPQDHTLLVQGYSPSGKPMPYHLFNAGAAGGLYSNAEDMVRYIGWQLDETNPVHQAIPFCHLQRRAIASRRVWFGISPRRTANGKSGKAAALLEWRVSWCFIQNRNSASSFWQMTAGSQLRMSLATLRRRSARLARQNKKSAMSGSFLLMHKKPRNPASPRAHHLHPAAMRRFQALRADLRSRRT